MSTWRKTLEKVMSGQSDANIAFLDACTLLTRLGYVRRQSGGSHRIFTKPGCTMLNLQNRGGKIPPYQVHQVREAIKNQDIQ